MHGIIYSKKHANPLRTKEELHRMQSLGVISPIDKPSPWCARMVVVPKPSGDVRICVDLKPLNEGMLCEFHPLPKVEATLAHLYGVTIFSKLDANSRFWQSHLPVVNNIHKPFGRYYLNKLTFWDIQRPQVIPEKVNTILLDFKGVLCWMDDILVFISN